MKPLWEIVISCQECTHFLRNTPNLDKAFEATAKKLSMSQERTARAFFAKYHENGHKR